MPRTCTLALLLALAAPIAGAPSSAPAHELEPGRVRVAGDLGVVHFQNSGAPRAQAPFLRGLLLLHSFEYAAARQSFVAAQKLDPAFALAVWGEALTFNHTLWHEQDTQAARAALGKLGASPDVRIARGATPRERDYLASVEKLYGPGTKGERDAAYSAALADLAHRYPDDLDARSLYALSLLGLSPVRNVATYMRAAAEAEAVYEIQKRHPGALHYLIHAYDDPAHAPLGLRAARRYAAVAPAASHAQHMTSHIFFALGLWDDAIDANVASLRVAREQGARAYHSLLWLEYAYLQEGKREQAADLIRSVAHDVEAGATKENRLRLAAARATWLVETRAAPGADADASVDSSGVLSIGNFAVHDFARGITAARAGDLVAAQAALVALRGRCDAARVQPPGENPAWYDALDAVELGEARALAMALDGTLQFYAGEHAPGLDGVRAAIDAASHFEFEYGPPWSAKPLDELLGELLLADGQSGPAADAFRRTLAAFPNRRLALEGLNAATAP